MANESIKKLTYGGLMTALVFVGTYLSRVPLASGQAYIHAGDSMIFIAAIFLGWRYGAFAAGVGSALADILLSYSVFAPYTFVIKAIMAIIVARSVASSAKSLNPKSIVGMILAGVWMVLAYQVPYYYLIKPDFNVNLLTIAPFDALQAVTGIVVACAILAALRKTKLFK